MTARPSKGPRARSPGARGGGRAGAALALCALLCCGRAAALSVGDLCVLTSDVDMVMTTEAGRLETVVESGRGVRVVAVGETSARIAAGEAEGVASLAVLEEKCVVVPEVCHLGRAVTLHETTRGQGRSWRIEVGADLAVLRRGKTWIHARAGIQDGYVRTEALETACAASPVVPGRSVDAVDELLEREEGPGLVLLPFALARAQDASAAATFADMLWSHMLALRPDAARLPDAPLPRVQGALEATRAARERAVRGQVAYALVGRLERDGEELVLALAVLDARDGKVVKGVKVRPAPRPDDAWAHDAAALLASALPPVPGVHAPNAATLEPQELDGPAGPPPAPPTARTGAGAAPGTASAPQGGWTQARPWWANSLAYTTLGTATALAVAGGVLGALAWSDVEAAGAEAPAAEERLVRLRSAEIKAGVADGLAGGAALLGVAAVVLFAVNLDFTGFPEQPPAFLERGP